MLRDLFSIVVILGLAVIAAYLIKPLLLPELVCVLIAVVLAASVAMYVSLTLGAKAGWSFWVVYPVVAFPLLFLLYGILLRG